MTEERSLIQVVDHTTFDFLVPKRNAKAHASLPVPLTRVPFHQLMDFINRMILPPIIARGGFNIEVSGGVLMHARFKPKQIGFGPYCIVEFSTIGTPEARALMMRDAKLAPRQQEALMQHQMQQVRSERQ